MCIMDYKNYGFNSVFYMKQGHFNSILANYLIVYPLKTQENIWFSGVSRGYEMGTLARNCLRLLS